MEKQDARLLYRPTTAIAVYSDRRNVDKSSLVTEEISKKSQKEISHQAERNLQLPQRESERPTERWSGAGVEAGDGVLLKAIVPQN